MKKRKRRKHLLGGKARPQLPLNPALSEVTHPWWEYLSVCHREMAEATIRLLCSKRTRRC